MSGADYPYTVDLSAPAGWAYTFTTPVNLQSASPRPFIGSTPPTANDYSVLHSWTALGGGAYQLRATWGSYPTTNSLISAALRMRPVYRIPKVPLGYTMLTLAEYQTVAGTQQSTGTPYAYATGSNPGQPWDFGFERLARWGALAANSGWTAPQVNGDDYAPSEQREYEYVMFDGNYTISPGSANPKGVPSGTTITAPLQIRNVVLYLPGYTPPVGFGGWSVGVA